jgi:hypothetical protein
VPTRPAGIEPDEGSATAPPDDQSAAEPSRVSPIARARVLASGCIARHPALLRVLEWLGWNNPGGSMSP